MEIAKPLFLMHL